MRRKIAIGSRRLSYLDTVAEAAAPGAARGTVLFLHAFPLQAAMWQPQLDGLPAGWRGLAPDLAGFGESAPFDGTEGRVSLDQYARDALCLIDALGIREVVVVGLSMGGYVTFALHRRAAERLRGLLLADTKAGADTPEGRAGRDRMLELLARAGVEGVADEMLPKLLSEASRESRPELVASVRRLAHGSARDGIRHAIERLRDRPDSTPELARIEAPTMLLVGAQDAVTPPDESRRMQEKIRGAELEVIEGAAHLSNMEQSDIFNRALARFLIRTEQAS
jgi:pimeloyl-ACP methyl ester carboxylesterase